MSLRPRRSVLYMPGSNARAIEKARTLPADCIVLDLEDSVTPDVKPAARTQACAAVEAGGFGPREVVVRINGLDSAWWRDDIAAATAVKPDAILVPKVSSPGDLERIAERLADLAADRRIQVWAMMETPLAVLNAGAIAAATDGRTRLSADVEAEVRRHFGDLVFATTVPRSVRLAEAPSHGLPAIAYDRRSRGADAYWKVAMELVERA